MTSFQNLWLFQVAQVSSLGSLHADADWCTEVHVDVISNDFMRTLFFQKVNNLWLKLKETQKLELPNLMVRNFILGNFIRRMIKLQNWNWQETQILILTATSPHSLGIISDMKYMYEKLSKDSVNRRHSKITSWAEFPKRLVTQG